MDTGYGHDSRPINFDANASYGLLPQVWEEIAPRVSTYLNPSSIHSAGQIGRSIIEQARQEILTLIGRPTDVRVIFTSGATEANTTAVRLGMLSSRGSAVVSSVEHPSVLESVRAVASETGGDSLQVSPDAIGGMSEFLTDSVGFVSLMAANNETGHLYPVGEVFREIKRTYPEVLCHCDAVQLAGKGTLDFASLACDALTLSAHKMGGLAGVGALVVRESRIPHPLLYGGPQESRWRAGTENVLGIHSFGVAARLAIHEVADRTRTMRIQKELICTRLLAEIDWCEPLFTDAETLPNTLSVRFPGVSADDLVVALDLEGICLSAGSACASGKPLPSHVLLEYGLDEFSAREVVRISIPHTLSESALGRGIDSIVRCARRMQDKREKVA